MVRQNPFDATYKKIIGVKAKDAITNPLEFPLEVHVELTNRCNLGCEFCPVGQRGIKRPYGNMSYELFDALCDEVSRWESSIKLIRWGEPTLHPRIWEFIKLAKDYDLDVHLNTNGVKLNVKQVLKSGLNSIKISGHSKEAVKSIRKLIKKRGDAEKPFITVGYLSNEKNTYDYIGVDSYNVGWVKDLSKGGRAPKDCYEMFTRLSVDWDGTVVGCCGAYDRQMRLGDLNKESLKQIWDGEQLHAYKILAAKGRLELIQLCNHCSRNFD